MIGTSLALGLGLAGLGANAATQVIGAKKASSAAKDAAKFQTEAADKAQGHYDRAFQVASDLYAPYLSSGRTAASSLGRLVTPGPGAKYAAADPTMRPLPPTMRPGPQGAAPPTQPRTLGSIGSPRMVMLEAPDGSGVRPVPASQVERFLAAGAKVVN